MSLDGIDKINETKIDSNKFSCFFQNYKQNQNVKEIEYEIGSRIIGFPEEKENEFDKKEEILQCNKNIINYLKQQLNQEWQTYSSHKINVFPSEDWFGGVPCGEGIDQQSNNYISILSIVYKPKKLEENQRIAHFLRLSLYLSMRNLNTGGVCICTTPLANKELSNIEITSSLEKIDTESIYKTVNMVSKIPDIDVCPFSFKILEEGKSQSPDSENSIHLIKVEVDIEKVEMIKGKIRSGFTKYRSESPEISRDSMQNILAQHKW